jgi:uncharacterized protein
MTSGPVIGVEVVATARGPGRAAYFVASATRGVLLLSHGAGNGIESADLQALAAGLPETGWSVVLFEQPWRVAGRKVATPPPTLDEGLVAVAKIVTGHFGAAVPLIVGGRSAGARSALRCARGLGAVGALGLAFPLHPPGRPERSRLPELVGADVPVLLFQGDRDSMGKPAEFPDPLPARAELVGVPSADHSLRVPKSSAFTQAQVFELLVHRTAQWVERVVST